MTIRFATLADIPSLVEGGARMHALTRFKNQPYNSEKVAKAFGEIITKGGNKYAFLVAESPALGQRAVVGALIGVMEQQIFSDAWTASVMHYDVLPEARMGGHGVRLLKAFEQWAVNRGAFEITLGINSGVGLELLGDFARRVGYEKVGDNFVKST